MWDDIAFELPLLIQAPIQMAADLIHKELFRVAGSCGFEPLVDLLPKVGPRLYHLGDELQGELCLLGHRLLLLLLLLLFLLLVLLLRLLEWLEFHLLDHVWGGELLPWCGCCRCSCG